MKSPIISPDLEKGRGSLDFPLIVRDAPDEIPLSALSSKPSLSPESRDSPRNHARQEMTSPDRGGSKRLDLATQERLPWTLLKSEPQRSRTVTAVFFRLFPGLVRCRGPVQTTSDKAERSSHSTVSSLGPAARTLRRTFLVPVFGVAPF